MSLLNRRDVLLAATAAGLGASAVVQAADRAGTPLVQGAATTPASPPAAAKPSTPAVTPDFDRPPLNLLALLKMLGSTDPRDVAVTCGTGRVYACIAEQPPIPLFGTHSVSVTRSRLRPDGSFVLRQRIIGFRTAFDGDRPIDRMTNPVTGETVELPVTDYGVADMDYRLDGTYASRAGAQPTKLDRPTLRPWRIDTGVLAIHDDSLLSGVGPGQPKADVVTRFAPIHEIMDESIHSARSWFSFSAVDPFRPWLKMGRPGFQLWHVHGRSVDAARPLPEFIDRFVRERFPTLLELAAP
jgi:hypothetical protein